MGKEGRLIFGEDLSGSHTVNKVTDDRRDSSHDGRWPNYNRRISPSQLCIYFDIQNFSIYTIHILKRLLKWFSLPSKELDPRESGIESVPPEF